MDLPCASTLPTLPNVSQLCAECACAECVTAPARGRPGVRSGRRTRDESCPDRHADARHTGAGESRSQQTPRRQTRGRAEQRHADADSTAETRELRHRVLGDVHAVVLPAPVCSICSCRGGDRPPPTISGTEFVAEFMDPVCVSSGEFHEVQVVCAREAHTVRSVCGAVPTRGATWRYRQPGVHACLHLQCQPGASF